MAPIGQKLVPEILCIGASLALREQLPDFEDGVVDDLNGASAPGQRALLPQTKFSITLDVRPHSVRWRVFQQDSWK